MDKEQELSIIKDMQQVVAQMKIDDIEDNPQSETETFTCDCCGEEKSIAGSVVYNTSVFCNDCALYVEIGFALNKINSVEEVMAAMEDKRLADMCEFIKQNQKSINN